MRRPLRCSRWLSSACVRLGGSCATSATCDACRPTVCARHAFRSAATSSSSVEDSAGPNDTPSACGTRSARKCSTTCSPGRSTDGHGRRRSPGSPCRCSASPPGCCGSRPGGIHSSRCRRSAARRRCMRWNLVRKMSGWISVSESAIPSCSVPRGSARRGWQSS